METANTINPKYLYPVSYTIKQDGTKIYENTFLLGEDLTENQIKQLNHFNFSPVTPSEKTEDEKLKQQLRNLELTTEQACESKESAVSTLEEFGIIDKPENTIEELKLEWYKRSDYIKTKNVSVDLIWEFFLPHLSLSESEGKKLNKQSEDKFFKDVKFKPQ